MTFSLPLRNAEECEIILLVNRHSVANALGAVPNELRCRGGALAVDGLGVSALGGVGGVLGGGKTQDVGPLLKRLLVCL